MPACDNVLLKTNVLRSLHRQKDIGIMACRAWSSEGTSVSSPEKTRGNTPSPSDSMPPHAKALGYLGALPFWLFSTPVVGQFPVVEAMTGLSLQDFGTLQVAYGATILSFLGGVHWGLSMTTLTPIKHTAERYIWSVIPCLAAFPTVVMPIQHGAGIQAGLIGLVYAMDRSWAKRGGLPPWYMKLRVPLSIAAASGLSMTALVGPCL